PACRENVASFRGVSLPLPLDDTPWTARPFRLLLFGEQALFDEFLATNAVGCPGDGVEPLGLNLFAAVHTLAKAAVGDSIQGFLDRPKRVALRGALRKEQLFGVRVRGLVRGILTDVTIRFAPIVFSAFHHIEQLVTTLG